jgi:dihydroorotase
VLKKYLIKNGTLLSLLDGNDRKADVLVEDGIITKIAENIDVSDAEIINAGGMFITIGWIEAHCHFAGVDNPNSLDPVNDILRQGITYALDLGTLGTYDYPTFYKTFAYSSNLRFKAYLNIGRMGVYNHGRVMDFEGPEDILPESVVDVTTRYRSSLLGLKARIDNKFCFDPVYVMSQLRTLGDRLDIPIAVHAPRSTIGIEKLLSYLKKGDVLCHTLAGNSEVMNIIDKEGYVKPCVLEAKERGVIFDLSHGTNAYSYDTAEKAWKAGFFTDMISSDLHGRNVNGPVYNLGVVLTKVRGLTRKPWWWILKKAVVEPVRLLHIQDKAVNVQEGMLADLTVFRIDKGEFIYPDSKKENRTFQEKITAVYTCVESKVYVCRK